jgi:hypothetical protein
MKVLLQVISALTLYTAARAADEESTSYDFSVDVNIAMTGVHDEVQKSWYSSTGTHIYAIEVTPKDGSAPWKVMHRFNDFHTLISDLGTAADIMEGAPFPSRVAAPGVDAGQMVIDRRSTLEKWLQAVIRHPEYKDAWKPLLQKFLRPGAKPDKYMKDTVMDFFGNLMGMEAASDTPAPEGEEVDVSQLDVGVAMSGDSDEVRGTSHMFVIDITPVSGEARVLQKRFNDFYTLSTELGQLAGTISGAPFPPRHNLFKDKDEFLKERRAALAVWLQAVLKHPQAKTAWAAKLVRFLGSSGPGIYPGDEAKQTLDEYKKQLNTITSPYVESASKYASDAAAGASQYGKDTAASIQEAAQPYVDQMSEAAASVKASIAAKIEEAQKYMAAADTANTDFIEAKEKYDEAVSTKDKSEAEVEALKANMVELGERAAEGMVKAKDAMEDIEELSLEASASPSGGDAPKEDL